MKQISTITVITIIVCLCMMTLGNSQGNLQMEDCCAWSNSCQSYKVIDANTIDEMKEYVQNGMRNAGWHPIGGITFNSETEKYLQAMAHPRKVDHYP